MWSFVWSLWHYSQSVKLSSVSIQSASLSLLVLPWGTWRNLSIPLCVGEVWVIGAFLLSFLPIILPNVGFAWFCPHPLCCFPSFFGVLRFFSLFLCHLKPFNIWGKSLSIEISLSKGRIYNKKKKTTQFCLYIYAYTLYSSSVQTAIQ